METQNSKKNCSDTQNETKQEYSEINHRLDIAMKLKGFRIYNEFGRACGYTGEYISMILKRKYKPTLETAQKIAGVLGLKFQDIFELNDIQDLDFFKSADKQEEEK